VSSVNSALHRAPETVAGAPRRAGHEDRAPECWPRTCARGRTRDIDGLVALLSCETTVRLPRCPPHVDPGCSAAPGRYTDVPGDAEVRRVLETGGLRVSADARQRVAGSRYFTRAVPEDE
jgi:hypothetical protein